MTKSMEKSAKPYPYQDLIVFDDGTGYSKGSIRVLTEGAAKDYHVLDDDRVMAVVGTDDILQDSPSYTIPPLAVSLKGNPASYIVGQPVLTAGLGNFDSQKSRYTGDTAAVRFAGVIHRLYTATGLAVPGSKVVRTIHLTVGANAEVIRSVREPLNNFYTKVWNFAVDNVKYEITVARTYVGNQAIAAARWVRENPPAAMAKRMERMPLATSTIITIDGGRLSTDVAVLEPDPDAPGALRPHRLFAVMYGVGTIADRLRTFITSKTGVMVPPRAIERAMMPGEFYGWINHYNDRISVEKELEQIIKTVWDQTFTEIRSNTKDVVAQYILPVGGLAIVARNAMIEYPLKDVIVNGTELRLGEYSGFGIIEKPHLAVVLGLGLLGEADAQQQ